MPEVCYGRGMRSSHATALLYGLMFAATGVSLPFAGLWFQSQGLTGAEIAVILAAPMLARIVSGPLIAVWADGFRLRRSALAWLAAVAAVTYAGCALAEGFAAWLGLWFVAATAAASLIPLADALTLRLARRDGFVFAWPRGAGSLAFIAANVAMGLMVRPLGPQAIMGWIVAATALVALAALLALPREPVHETPVEAEAATGRFEGLGRLIGDRTFMTAIAGIGFIHASHAFYYGFSAIAWREQGVSARDIGLLWGVSVLVELVLMWGFEPWRRRRGISPFPLMAVGGVAAVLRWAALSFGPPEWMLWPLQALHALSFAAVFLGGLQLVEHLAPARHATAAQTLSSTLSAGVLIGLATMLSGPLYDAYGVGGYWAMAAMAGVGLACVCAVRRAFPAAA